MMTPKERSIFQSEINELISGDGDLTNQEFYERLIYALQVITSDLESFKYDFED